MEACGGRSGSPLFLRFCSWPNAIWPVVGFFWIASTIEARDAAALAKLVDFRALRFRAQERLADIWVSEYGFATTTSIC
jgi:DUF2939 family protein